MRMHPALDSWISWLMGQPAGLKLNRPLARFLGELYLWLLEVWMGMHMIIESAPLFPSSSLPTVTGPS